MKQALVPVRGIWSSRPSVDWLLVAVIVSAHVALLRYDLTSFSLDELAKDDRMRLFTTVATVSSLLFGFATASIAFFYGSAKGERVDLLKKVLDEQLLRTWRGALGAPLVATAVALLALAADTSAQGKPWVGWAVEGSLLFLGFRALRLRWLFIKTLTLVGRDLQNPPQTPVPSQSGSAPKAAKAPKRKHAAGSALP